MIEDKLYCLFRVTSTWNTGASSDVQIHLEKGLQICGVSPAHSLFDEHNAKSVAPWDCGGSNDDIDIEG